MSISLPELLEKCKNGSKESIAIIIHRFYQKAYDVAFGISGDVHLAEDATQEAFFTVFQKIENLKNPQAFSGWLFQIIRNKVYQQVRGRKKEIQGVTAEVSQEEKPWENIEKEELKRNIHKAVAKLSPVNKETVELFYLYERNQAEIAEKLNIPKGTVKRRLHDSRQKLKEVLEKSQHFQFKNDEGDIEWL